MGNCVGKLSSSQREEVDRYKPVNKGQSKQNSSKRPVVSQVKLGKEGTDKYEKNPENNNHGNSTDIDQQKITTAPLARLEDFNLGNKTNIRKQDGGQQEKSKKEVRREKKKSNEITNESNLTRDMMLDRRENVNRGHGHNPANFGYEFTRGVRMSGGKNKSSNDNDSTNLPVSSEDVQLETEVDGGSFPVTQSEIITQTAESYQTTGDESCVEQNQHQNLDVNEKTVMQETPEAFAEAGSTQESLMHINVAASHDWEGTSVRSRGLQGLPGEDGTKLDISAANVIIGNNGKIISKRTENIKEEEHHIFNESAGKGKEKIKAQNVIIGSGGEICEEAHITVDSKKTFHYGNPSGTDISQSTGGNLETTSDVNTKPLDITTVKAIAKAADSVGMICSPRNTGTVFRVGSDKVMTAWHIVKGIIYVHIKNQLDVKKLYQLDVFITFHYESAVQGELGRNYHIERLCYFNEELDIAVLKLKEKNNLPPALTDFVEFKSEFHQKDSFYLIGHPHGKKKQMDFVLKYWEPFGNRLKELNEWSRTEFYMYGYTGMLGYEGVSDKKKIIFDCNFRHGASGAPGIFVLSNGQPAVITILLRGFPSFYYSENFTDAEKRRVPQNRLKQQGVNMGAVQRDMESVAPILAKEIFPSNVNLETATMTKVGMETATKTKAGMETATKTKVGMENETNSLERKVMPKVCAGKEESSNLTSEKSHDNQVDRLEKTEKQYLHFAPLKREISMPESTDTAELLLTAAKETTPLNELESKKVKLQRQNATESEDKNTKTNNPCPPPLGGTKPYQELG